MTVAPNPPPRVLVVEDETVLAMLVEDCLTDEGYSVVGPFVRVHPALQAAERERLDAALLDINVAGEMVFPVADALDRRGVPVLLVSGYDDHVLHIAHHKWPRIIKPYRMNDVVGRLAAMIARGIGTPA